VDLADEVSRRRADVIHDVALQMPAVDIGSDAPAGHGNEE
jgi:hypothetical protein